MQIHDKTNMCKHREVLCTGQMVTDPQVEFVHSAELLQEALHGSGLYKTTTTMIKIKIRSVFEVANLL